MARITNGTIAHHGGGQTPHASLDSLSHLYGANKDSAVTGISAQPGDYMAFKVDSSPVPYFQIQQTDTSPWEYFFSASDTNPAPLTFKGPDGHDAHAIGSKQGAVGLGTKASTAHPSYDPHGAAVYFVARALASASQFQSVRQG